MLAGSVRVDGRLDGNIAMTAGQIPVGPRGSVRGSVQIGPGQIQVAPGGRILGAVQAGEHTQSGMICSLSDSGAWTLSGGAGAGGASKMSVLGVVHPHGPSPLGVLAALQRHFQSRSRDDGVVGRTLSWIGMLALALPVAAIWPAPLAGVRREIEDRAGTSALTGLAALILALPVLRNGSIAIIGIPVAWAAALGLAAAWFFGYVAVAGLVGERTASLARGSGPLAPLWALVLGTALLLAALAWVPILGGLVSLTVAGLGLGAVLLSRFGSGRPWLPARGGGPPAPQVRSRAPSVLAGGAPLRPAPRQTPRGDDIPAIRPGTPVRGTGPPRRAAGGHAGSGRARRDGAMAEDAERRPRDADAPERVAAPPTEAPDAVTAVPDPDDERRQDAARAALEVMRRFSLPG